MLTARTLLSTLVFSASVVSTHAEFISRPIQVSLRTDNSVRITKSFIYVDPNGRKWFVPANTVSDGASIPRLLWTPLGGPLDGQYRDAAFIHDYYYQVR